MDDMFDEMYVSEVSTLCSVYNFHIKQQRDRQGEHGANTNGMSPVRLASSREIIPYWATLVKTTCPQPQKTIQGRGR